ncbi:MAG: DNA repair protein RadA [Bacteroidia bacterium]|nr:DNA repair protein RadA [Bacteroidia bacterium]
MAGTKVIFTCNACGSVSPKWIGHCPNCNEWNTYHEEIISRDPRTSRTQKLTGKIAGKIKSQPVKLSQIEVSSLERMLMPDQEFNRVVGGGIVPGSITLIGGQPGIGKSTLLLNIALKSTFVSLYVSGEESKEQIKRRADRLGGTTDNCLIFNETNIDVVLSTATKYQPDLIIIDSIQTLYSSDIESTPGSISQIKDCTWQLQKYAKATNMPIIIIGHINKEGTLAGPKMLEHIVDTVIQFEGDQNYAYRILRTLKNRFGSTDELGIYEMQTSGLREVSNPSELLISQNEVTLSGSAICASIEGIRPLLVETQALVSNAIYGTPQRSANGYDLRKLHMLLAVLEKRCGFPIGANDVFLNIAGGVKIVDPGLDLSIIAALISSLQEIEIPDSICFAGEVGLSGEIRSVKRIEQRIMEANRLGFQQILVPKHNLKGIESTKFQIEVIGISKIEDMLEILQF